MVAGPAAAAGTVPAPATELAEERRALGRALGALPLRPRQAVVLQHPGGAPLAEIAALRRVPVSTVQNRLYAARQRLKGVWSTMADEESAAHRPSRDRRFVQEAGTRLFPFRTEVAYYEDRARGLVTAWGSGLPEALRVIAAVHPGFAGRSPAEVASGPFTEADARAVVALQHGFPDWAAFVAHIHRLAADAADPARPVEPFLAAFRAIEAGDAAALGAALDAHPDLARARGTNGNTLLHLAAGCRALVCARLLLARGADADAANDRGSTPLHQAAYGDQPELAEALLAAGARLSATAYGDGGTPLVWALFWGHRGVGAILAQRGVTPANLRAAAGSGALALLESLFTPAGGLRPEAGAGRGFYRPHTGFPEWTPRDDPQEVLDEAFVYACRNGQLAAMEALLRHGARIEADPYRGTGLIWAAAVGQAAAVAWLLDHGAGVDARGTFGGPTHGQGVTALQIAAQAGHLGVVELLLQRGADPRARDDLHGGDAAGWAEQGGERAAAVLALLRGLG